MESKYNPIKSSNVIYNHRLYKLNFILLYIVSIMLLIVASISYKHDYKMAIACLIGSITLSVLGYAGNKITKDDVVIYNEEKIEHLFPLRKNIVLKWSELEKIEINGPLLLHRGNNTKLYVNLGAEGIYRYIKFLNVTLPDEKKDVVNKLVNIYKTVEDEISNQNI